MSARPTNSAQGVLRQLDETDQSQVVYALKKIDQIVATHWNEISDKLPRIEELSEDEQFPHHELAASIASKVYFFLEEYDDSLQLALKAGDKFNINEHTQYVDTLISRCVDKYIEQRLLQEEEKKENADDFATNHVNPKLESIINRMFDRCFDDLQFNQAIGVALQARRFDKVKESIEKSGNIEEMLSYTYTLARSVVKQKKVRDELLRLLLLIYEHKQGGKFDYFKILKCQFFLKHPEATAQMLLKLVREDQVLVAYQLAIDIQETEDQPFIMEIRNKIEISDCAKKAQLERILKGELHDTLNMQFLRKNNHSDMVLIENLKKAIGEKNSITHGACVWANGIMNAYTTNDTFLRDNINWVAKATNWSRFSATASLGMIHMGNKKEALNILNPYFRGQGGADGTTSPYSQAGAYYAYGLIHANQATPELISYFTDGLRNAGNSETIQHGVALGLGTCAMATNDAALYEEFKNIMYADSAIAGEAAALGMGLVKVGNNDETAIMDMLTYAGQTKHEKVIRGLALSLAFLVYGKEEQGDSLIEQMVRSKDSLIRYGAMFAIGMAYCGTSNNDAIKKLLHHAVSDVSDDVKRAAMMNLGFLSFRKPHQIPGLVKQLSDSYNPHLRYGAAMAVGVGCAGTGLPEALKILAPLTTDGTDFVRQGALIALAMVFVQITEGQEPKVETIKKLYTKRAGDKYEEVLTKMGSVISMGIINAGGRNATISMQTRSGTLRMGSVIGMALFLQHWYWYPLLNFLSLTLSPTALVGLNENLKVPKSFSVVSMAKPSQFKYPEFLKREENKKEEKVTTAVLSTTAKVKAKTDKKKGEGMDVDNNNEEAKAEEQKKEEEDKKEEEVKEEPAFLVQKNPSRVISGQEKVIRFDRKNRYVPLLPTRKSGFVILVDQRQGEAGEQFYDDEEIDASAPNPQNQAADFDIPADFIFDPNQQR